MTQNDNCLKEFGKLVRQRRRSLDISQQELANIIEVHRSWIGRVEKGTTNPSLVTMMKICKGLNCSVLDLMPENKKE
ncbi:MAG TPA: helix-turn-helix transcriptional regulator [Rhabdochlamydiaceae bacterium]|nr:helix-turn-helix transcriptional regulator [Rhabdochlamydiaceae bacterium]